MTTYYVRTDGGTAAQSNGLYDEAYPGSPTAANSAFADPWDAITACTYGDIIQLRAGDTFYSNLEACGGR